MTNKIFEVYSENFVQYSRKYFDKISRREIFPCKICGEASEPYDVLDFALTCNTPRAPAGLSGIPVYYYRCCACGFIFTDFCDQFTPSEWSSYIYNEFYYSTVDPDYADRRPGGNASLIKNILGGDKNKWLGLDYGGGNGRTALLLRKMGFNFESYDPYGLNETSRRAIGRFNFCSSFEVAEHVADPHAFLRDIVSLCSSDKLAILIGTHVNDGHVLDNGRLNWWYASPRNGHISLYSLRSLKILAQAYDLEFLSLTGKTHLLSRGYTRSEAWRLLIGSAIGSRMRNFLKFS